MSLLKRHSHRGLPSRSLHRGRVRRGRRPSLAEQRDLARVLRVDRERDVLRVCERPQDPGSLPAVRDGGDAGRPERRRLRLTSRAAPTASDASTEERPNEKPSEH